jgi:hypothetical protein
MRTAALAILLACLLGATAGADQTRKSFVDRWLGKRVEVKRTLYTLMFNERGRLGKTYRSKREGLMVVTPSAGTYFQFDGRDAEQDIIAREPQQVMDRIGELYRRQESLEIGFYLRIEPLLLVRYEAGGALIVKDVRIDRNRVRFSFGSLSADSPAGELATALTIQWPTDLSASLTERPLIDALVRQFVDDPASRTASAIRD